MKLGRTTGLYGQTGTGKTTQGGQYAKWLFKTTGKRCKYVGADLGGSDSIEPLIRSGIIEPEYFEEASDPWSWINKQVTTFPGEEIGLIIYDSGTSMGEALLSSAAKLGASGLKVGSQPAQKFNIPGTTLNVGSNTESHYMVVQSFLLDAIWKSTWLARRGVDILWTFGEHRAENPNEASIIGAKLAGRALTGSLPKWLRYTLRLSTDASSSPPEHILHIQEGQEGMSTFYANARYPLEAATPLPVAIKPANIVEFWEMIERGQAEADEALAIELGR